MVKKMDMDYKYDQIKQNMMVNLFKFILSIINFLKRILKR